MIWAYTIHYSIFAHIIFRYIVIPSNRGKDTKQKGKALIGTGGSGETWLPLATLYSQSQVENIHNKLVLIVIGLYYHVVMWESE